jgi:hypothetical protein
MSKTNTTKAKANSKEIDALFANDDAPTVDTKNSGKPALKSIAKPSTKPVLKSIAKPAGKAPTKGTKVAAKEPKADDRKVSFAGPVPREGSIRAAFAAAFKKPTAVDTGCQAILTSGFKAPRSDLFNSNPFAFVKGHIGVYISRGWLVEA